MRWIGTVEVNWDAGLEPGKMFCLCVSPGLNLCPDLPPMSRYIPNEGSKTMVTNNFMIPCPSVFLLLPEPTRTRLM